MFVNLFKKESGDSTRYWASVSTEIYDAKKKRGTGKYINASMPVRLADDAREVFDKIAVKSKSKGVTYGRFKVEKSLLEAVQPKDNDYAYARLVILKMTDASEDE